MNARDFDDGLAELLNFRRDMCLGVLAAGGVLLVGLLGYWIFIF